MKKGIKIITGLIMSTSLGANAAQTTQTQYTTTSTSQTATQETQTNIWNLSEADFKKYQTLTPLVKGLSNKTHVTTPYELLGMYAETEAEQRHYARLFVKAYRDYVGRTLQFERIAREEEIKLFGANEEVIDLARIQKTSSQKNSNTSLYHFYADPSCLEQCQAGSNKAIQLASAGHKVDIFIATLKNNDIQTWASYHKIPLSLMGTHLTLNYLPKSLQNKQRNKHPVKAQ